MITVLMIMMLKILMIKIMIIAKINENNQNISIRNGDKKKKNDNSNNKWNNSVIINVDDKKLYNYVDRIIIN